LQQRFRYGNYGGSTHPHRFPANRSRAAADFMPKILVFYGTFPHLSSTPSKQVFLYGNLGCLPHKARDFVRNRFGATGKCALALAESESNHFPPSILRGNKATAGILAAAANENRLTF
jgi:hypothetical protein